MLDEVGPSSHAADREANKQTRRMKIGRRYIFPIGYFSFVIASSKASKGRLSPIS